MAKSTFTGLTLMSTLPLRPYGILKSTHLYQKHSHGPLGVFHVVFATHLCVPVQRIVVC